MGELVGSQTIVPIIQNAMNWVRAFGGGLRDGLDRGSIEHWLWETGRKSGEHRSAAEWGR